MVVPITANSNKQIVAGLMISRCSTTSAALESTRTAQLLTKYDAAIEVGSRFQEPEIGFVSCGFRRLLMPARIETRTANTITSFTVAHSHHNQLPQ
jgi:hypothetical protein